jgi:uncharacterized protein YkwD
MSLTALTLVLLAIPAAEEMETEMVSQQTQVKPALHEHPTLLDMLRRNNELRKGVGLRPQTMNAVLTRAAQNHARFMANTGSFSHYSNYGPFGRARRFGFGGNVRENIALGHRNVLQAFVGWRNSGGHWASIVSDAPEVGFGYAVSKGGTPYWVAVYGYPTDKDKEAETKLLEHRTDVAAGSPADSSTSAKADSDSSASKSASSNSSQSVYNNYTPQRRGLFRIFRR